MPQLDIEITDTVLTGSLQFYKIKNINCFVFVQFLSSCHEKATIGMPFMN